MKDSRAVISVFRKRQIDAVDAISALDAERCGLERNLNEWRKALSECRASQRAAEASLTGVLSGALLQAHQMYRIQQKQTDGALVSEIKVAEERLRALEIEIRSHYGVMESATRVVRNRSTLRSS